MLVRNRLFVLKVLTDDCSDLKMENILLSGFERKANKDDTPQTGDLTAKLGDLGIVMSPIKGIVQPLAYRAPEVYFRHEISPAADIWSWGLIYCQLLEAQASFLKTGMYDDLLQGTSVQKSQSVQKAIANDFNLGSLNYYDGCALPYQAHDSGEHWERLIAKGVPEKEINFLRWVLNPVPTERPTAQEILDAGWLAPASENSPNATEFLQPRKKVARKRSEPSLFTRLQDKFTKKRRGSIDDKEVKPTPGKDTHSTPLAVDTQVAAKSREDSLSSRPATPRSTTGKPGGTFLNYGGFMK